jgi:hypothetical protein
VLRDAFVALLCVLVVRSVLRPETDPVRTAPGRRAGDVDSDPDWPAVTGASRPAVSATD